MDYDKINLDNTCAPKKADGKVLQKNHKIGETLPIVAHFWPMLKGIQFFSTLTVAFSSEIITHSV